MGFIESLNKYKKKVSLNKTNLYKSIYNEKCHLERNGFKVSIKDEFDMFDLEIILKGFQTKNLIDDAYSMFLSKNYDLINYLNYEEKRKMFNLEIADILENAPHFYDEDNQINIYIPFLEPFVNSRYINDYSVLMLKAHHDYVENYKMHIHSAIELYGNDIYRTDFSCLQIVYEDDRHICFYYDELYTIYIFKKENLEYLNEVTIIDNKCKENVDIDEVKEIIKMVEEYQYQECLDYLLEKKFICEKTYKKVLKKYK